MTSSENHHSKFQPLSENRSKLLAFNSFSKLPKIASDQYFIQTAFPVHVTNSTDFNPNPPQTDTIVSLLTINNTLLNKIDESLSVIDGNIRLQTTTLNNALSKLDNDLTAQTTTLNNSLSSLANLLSTINSSVMNQTEVLNGSLSGQVGLTATGNNLLTTNNNLLTQINDKIKPETTNLNLRKFFFLGVVPIATVKTPLSQIFSTLRYTNRSGVGNDNVVNILAREGITNSSGVLLNDVKVTISASVTSYIESGTAKNSAVESLPILSSASASTNSENFYIYKQVKNFNISEIPSSTTYFIPTVPGNYPDKYTPTIHVYFQVETY
jgi:hypothetical protein